MKKTKKTTKMKGKDEEPIIIKPPKDSKQIVDDALKHLGKAMKNLKELRKEIGNDEDED